MQKTEYDDGIAQREMTLSEVCGRLPEGHKARTELAALKADSTVLRALLSLGEGKIDVPEAARSIRDVIDALRENGLSALRG